VTGSINVRHESPVDRSLVSGRDRSRAARAALFGCALWLAAWPLHSLAAAAEPEACRTVRFSDIGWTDVTATTGLASRLLRNLGYEPRVTVLSVPVTFASLKNRDIDVFLGNWMPAMEADIRPYVDDGSVEVVGANLTGAKYTLAVPAYTHDAGLRDFADIQRFAAELKHRIYGIEPGNDGNRLVLGLIKSNQFGLGKFRLVESSEQGMLAQVERAFAAREPIVYFGWEPHPMNTRFDMRYLTGGDGSFGPDFGGATVTREAIHATHVDGVRANSRLCVCA
jgi:glycine betaine/proline transport system substrate-binding protein